MSTPPNDSNPQWGSPDAHGEQPGPAAPGPYGGVEPAPTGSKFGTSGYDPGASYNAPIAEPKQYSLLKTMTLASFGLYVLSALVSMIPMLTGEAEDMARAELEGVDLGGASVDDALAMGMVFAWGFVLVPLVIAVVFYLLVYFGLKNVKGWARITGVVMAIIGLVVTLGTLLFGGGFESTLMIIGLIISLVWAAVTIYWLVLAFNSQVRDYMDQQNA